MNKLFFFLIVVLAAFSLTAEEAVFEVDFEKSGVEGFQMSGRLAPTIEKGQVALLRNDSLNQGADISLVRTFAPPANGAFLALRLDAAIFNTTPNGKSQSSGRWGIILKNATSKLPVGFYLSSGRYHRNRRASLMLGEKNLELPFNFAVDSPLSMLLLLDTNEGRAAAVVQADGQTLFSTGLQKCASFIPDTATIYSATVSVNDGMNFRMDKLALNTLNEGELTSLARRPGEAENGGEEYCATAPRHYQHVNTALYNAAIIGLAGDNQNDRMALATPEAAEKRAKELEELGFNVVLYSGRHFRANFLEEFDKINEAGRLLSTALKAKGIELIEHHDPTIMSYRGYPMMLHTLDWLQRDIRTGETSYWYCPQNPDFARYMIDYLRRYQQVVGAAGFMIDELTYGSGNFCACDYCRASYAKETGKQAPDWSNPRAMDAVQRDYRRFAVTKVLELESDMLNAMQEIRPDTIMMTYCSDYGDAISANEDLTRTAAYNCPFVGWENMIYNTLNSWVSNMRNLKMRDGYGDFYNIPVWSLNRECVTPNAHYVSWMMCQAGRHGIWYGTRALTTDDESKAFFKTYNKWADRMPHRFARPFTKVGMLNSTQTQKASNSREFAWFDYIGTADTFLRNNLQYTTLLDGDLFYPNRLGQYTVLILPSQAALSATQCNNLVNWVKAGGTAVITGNTSRFDEYGNPLMNYRLADALKVKWDGSLNGTATITAPGSSRSFELAGIDKLVPTDNSVKLLAEAKIGGTRHPFALETPCGEGCFITVGGQIGTLLYELEMRNGGRYNYRENPGAADFLCWLYRHAVKDALVEFEGFPKDVPAIANQLMDGPDAGTIYVQMMNFSGKDVEFGKTYSYGTPENITFPEIKGDLTVKVMVPCGTDALLERPFEGNIAIRGHKVGDATLFIVPGKELKSFAQLKISGAKPQMKILEPPMVKAGAGKTYAPLEQPFRAEQFYKPAEMRGEIVEAPKSFSSGDFTVNADGAVYLKGELLFTGELWQSENEVTLPVRRGSFQENATTVGWKNGKNCGFLTSMTGMDGDCSAVRETALRDDGRLEVTVGGTLLPKDYQLNGFGYALRIPKKLLVGTTATIHHGMHRSDPPPKQYTFTGNEPDGRLRELSQVRDIQINGKLSFSIDFTTMGPWGLFNDDLSSETYSFFVVDGDSYVAFMASGRFRYGAKYCHKIVVRSGVTDFDRIHPTRFAHYQYNRGASQRIQFTDGNTATGMAIHPQRVMYSKEFEKGSPKLWSKPVSIVKTRLGGPFFSAGAKVSGDNSLTLTHADALVLVNVALAGPSKGTASINGKQVAFDIAEGSKKTVVLPVYIRNGKATLSIEGEAIVCGIIVQPVLFAEEDYLFDRTFWNTGLVPYLIPQLKCDKQAWRFWSDVAYRQAKE